MRVCFFYNIKYAQFYGTEAHAPLCEMPSAQNALPPSYEDVMAAESEILEKFEKRCTSNIWCEHSHSNRSHPEQTATDNSNSTNTIEELRVIRAICEKAITDTVMMKFISYYIAPAVRNKLFNLNTV